MSRPTPQRLAHDLIRDLIADIRTEQERGQHDSGYAQQCRNDLTRLWAEKQDGGLALDRWGWPICLKQRQGATP